MFCEYCGRKLEDGEMFCPECGTPVSGGKSMETGNDPSEDKTEYLGEQQESCQAGEQRTMEVSDDQAEQKEEVASAEAAGSVIFCPQCGTRNNAGDMFCAECGARLDGSAPANQAGEQKKKEKRHQKKGKQAGNDMTGKKRKKLPRIIAGILVLAVVAVALAIFVLPKGKTGADRFYYLKDNELWRGNINRTKKTQMVDEGIFEEEEYVGIDNYIQESADGKYLIYPTDYPAISSYSDCFDLQCVSLRKKGAEPVKLASNVKYYTLLANNQLFWLDDDNNLYRGDLKGNREKLAKKVTNYLVSEDYKTLVYLTDNEQKLYSMSLKNPDESEKLDSDVTEICAASDSLNVIVYRKDEGLYVYRNLTDKEKIAEGAEDVTVGNINGDFRILYTKPEDDGDSFTMGDFIEDDLAASDSEMKEPDITDYQHTEQVQSFWGTREQTVTDDAYYEEANKYAQKEDRDRLREYFANTTLSLSGNFKKGNVYLYDGKTGSSVAVQESLWIDRYGVYELKEDCLEVLTYIKEDELPKVCFSEVMNQDVTELQNEIMDEVKASVGMAVLVNENFSEIDMEGKSLDHIVVDKDGKKIYGLVYEEDFNDGKTLIRISCEGGSAQAAETMDEDVDMIQCIQGGRIYYIKEMDEDEVGELYCNGKKVDTDVYAYGFFWKATEDGSFMYRTDFSSNDRSGTLKLYDGKEAKKIASDVYSVVEYGDERIFLLTDYNTDKNRGELKLYNGRSVNTVDSDVTGIYKVMRAE